MASTYALPVSAMQHSHSHSSHSPSKLGLPANASRTLRQERSSGSLHGHSRSDAPYDYKTMENPYQPDRFRAQSELPTPPLTSALPASPWRESHSHGHSHGHSHSPSPPRSHSHDHGHDHSHGHSQSPSRSHSHDHGHDHHGHHDHDHDHAHAHSHSHGHSDLTRLNLGSPKFEAHAHDHSNSTQEKPSRFTSLILPQSEKWPLLHSILIEKDSRRIFYFMR
jgi:zinc transporter 5/7